MKTASRLWMVLIITCAGGYNVFGDEITKEERMDCNSGSKKAFNYVLGTQTFGVKYQFTDETRLVETAKAINDMGSNVLKCYLGPKAEDQYKIPVNDYKSLKELAAKEPSYQKILEMPFDHYLFWVYSYGEPNDVLRKGWTQKEKKAAYNDIYELTCFLLSKYNNSGKTFYIGQWEGDWAMMGPPLKYENEPTDLAIASTIDWLNTRQAAVDAAKKDTPHKNVEVYHYLEVNIIIEAMKGNKTIVNSVLPKTNVDYVSYSAYDAIYPHDANLTFEQRLESIGNKLIGALDYIESKIPPKDVPGKRVFIGEYGFPISAVDTPQAQKEASLAVAINSIQWGCPFVLYWEMYDNEAEEGGANGKGYWMIDNKGIKQPIYDVHYEYYFWARKFVSEKKPTEQEFRKAAAHFLKTLNQ